MSILALTSGTLIGTPATGNLEYNGQFFGTDSNASRAQLQRITSGTAVTTTSGTSIDFTGFPSWAKRITLQFNGISANSTSNWLVQLGSGSIQTTGYVSGSQNGGSSIITSTTGMIYLTGVAASTYLGLFTLTSFGSNIWVSAHNTSRSDGAGTMGGGSVTLSGSLDRVRLTTVSGTDTFDAGSINFFYEG